LDALASEEGIDLTFDETRIKVTPEALGNAAGIDKETPESVDN
jgi:hypothetical protein